MKYTNKYALPEAIFQAVTEDTYTGGSRQAFLTASQFSTPPKIRVLSKGHSEEIEVDVADRLFVLLGQAVHAILERSEPSSLTEQRLYGNLGDRLVSGQYDRLTLTERGTLQDYKVTSVWSFIQGVKPEWELQLNVLRWLAHRNGYEVKRLEIVGILRDWVASKRFDPDYPQVPMVIQKVPVWDLELTEERMLEIMARHADAETRLPECTDDERWMAPPKWAVIKGKNKRATKLYDNEKEAFEHANLSKDFWVQYRPGRYRRCEDYCPVSEFCEQWKADSSDE